MSRDPDDTPEDTKPPHERLNLVGHSQAEAFLRQLLDQNALNNGWMLTGPTGIGKATLAYRLARALLDRNALINSDSLEASTESSAIRLIGQKAHPDLFIAERQWDEKKQRYTTEITIENIRSLINSLSRTSNTGFRVAIIDTADELNRNAANALLKVLEEPPTNTVLLLLVNSPGRLLSTIRSRCRVLTLHPVTDHEVSDFLQAEAGLPAEKATELAVMAEGRPGHALQLAHANGLAAMSLVDDFLVATTSRQGFHSIAEKLAPRASEDLWQSFRILLLQRLSHTVRQQASAAHGGNIPPGMPACPNRLLRVWEELKRLTETAEALNSDRGQLILTMGIRAKSILNGAG